MVPIPEAALAGRPSPGYSHFAISGVTDPLEGSLFLVALENMP
jgi:hypothetical protein